MKNADHMGGWESGGDIVQTISLTDLLWCMTNTYPFRHTNMLARSVTATAFVLFPQSGHLAISVKAVLNDVSSKETMCVRVARILNFGIYCPVHESEATSSSKLEGGIRGWVWDFTLALALLGGSSHVSLRLEFLRADGRRMIGYCINRCGAWNRDLKIKSLDGRAVGKCTAGDHVIEDAHDTHTLHPGQLDTYLQSAVVASPGGRGSPRLHQLPSTISSAPNSGQLSSLGSGTNTPTAIREDDGDDDLQDNIYEEIVRKPWPLPLPTVNKMQHFPSIPPPPTSSQRRSTAPSLSQTAQNSTPAESNYEEVVLSDAVRIFKEAVPTYVSNPMGATMSQSLLIEVIKNMHNNQTQFPSPISLEEARLLLCVVGCEDNDAVGCTDFNHIYNTVTAIGASFMTYCPQGQGHVGVDHFWKCVGEVYKGNYTEERKQQCVKRFCRYADRVSYDAFIRIMADLRSDLAG